MIKRYIIENREVFDPNKKTIIVFMLETVIAKNTYAVTTRYFFNTMDILLQDFNILLICRNTGTAWIEIAMENNILNKCMFLCFDTIEKKYFKLMSNEQSHDEKVVYIEEAIQQIEDNEKEIMGSLVGTIMSHSVLPALDTAFEILSYGDNTLLEKQIKSSEGYIDKIKKHRILSHTGYIYKPVGFAYEFSFYLMKHYPNIYHYTFSHDSNSTWLHYTKKYNPYTKNVKCFYLVDQIFENREFYKFPMSEMQDFLNNEMFDKNYYEEILNNKKYDFIFGGLFPYKITQRYNAWYKYFQNLNVNGIIRTQVDGKTKINDTTLDKEVNVTEPALIKLISDIKNHPLIANTLPYDEYNDDLKNGMFTILPQVYYGKYDNFTLRFVGSLYYGILPLITEEYDPHNLQIPKKFRDKLLVKNHEDVQNKCKYYREHYDEYKKLFYDMYDYYIKPFYFDKQYYENEFKTNFFKEIYKEQI